jgi:long-chain fatty acid transport protein
LHDRYAIVPSSITHNQKNDGAVTMQFHMKKALAVAIVTGLTLPTLSYATNGLALPGYGAKSIGMGGTSIALQMDSLAGAVNPAAISGMSTRFDIGVGLFNPPRRAYVEADNDPVFGTSIAESRSRKDLFPIPNLGFVSPINDELTFGINAIGGGLGVEYQDGIYDFKNTGKPISMQLIQMQIPITLAYKVDNNTAVAASAVMAAQMFKNSGFSSFAPVTSDSENYTDRGNNYSFGAGIRIGTLYTTDDKTFSIGGYYHSRVYMSKFDKYRGLFAEHGDLDIPANFGVGIAYKITPEVTTAFDIVRYQWSSVAAIGNKGPALYTGDPIGTAAGGGAGQIGADDGMGFGWEDQTVFKLGFSYDYSPKTTFTTGINYGKTPIPQDQLAFGVLGPAVTEKHLAFGVQHKLNGFTMFDAKEAEISLSYLHGFKEKMSGLSPLGHHFDENGNRVDFAGYAEFEMVQNQLEISYGLKF